MCSDYYYVWQVMSTFPQKLSNKGQDTPSSLSVRQNVLEKET